MYKRFIFLYFIFCGTTICGIVGFSYFMDPYGLRSLDGKFMYPTVSTREYLYNAKIRQNADCYVIGTSRALNISPMMLEEMMHKRVLNLPKPSTILAEENIALKAIGSAQAIFGFDVFSLNVSAKTKERLAQWDRAINEEYYPYLRLEMAYIAVKMIVKGLLHNPKNYDEKVIDAKPANNYANQDILNRVKNNYKGYKVDTAALDETIALLKPQDIVILFPKYFYYYIGFSDFYGVQDKYFAAVKELVLRSKAKIYSFYGINPVTLDRGNFDDFGWHFKPKVATYIFDFILKNKRDFDDFGVLLTRENIDLELAKIKAKIAKYKAGLVH